MAKFSALGLVFGVILLVSVTFAYGSGANQIYVGCTPVPTFTPSLWANCVTATSTNTRTLAPIFMTATAITPPRPTVEEFSTPFPTQAGLSYVVTALQGLNVRGDCRSTSNCPPIGNVVYGSVIWVSETAESNGYVWGKIGTGQWVALRSTDSRYQFVRPE